MRSTAFKTMFDESMGSKLDRFGGASAWDAYIDWKEDDYRKLIEGKTCLDCDLCVKCGVEGHEGVGYCKEMCDFVSDADTPESIGCETFVQ